MRRPGAGNARRHGFRGIGTRAATGGDEVPAVVRWGPDFGGTTGDNPGVAVAASLPVIAAVYEPATVVAAVSLPVIAATYTAIGAISTIVDLKYDATYIAGSNAAANDGPDNWTNPNNANGLRDGTEASRAGQVAASTDANLRLTYADPGGGLETFTITTVELRYDTRQTGTALNNGGLHHEYRLATSGAWTSLAVFTGDVDNNPTTYDITTAVGGSWTKINDLQVRIRAVLGIGTNLVTCFCDAVELRIVATKTVTS